MIKINIDVTKIHKNLLVIGKKGGKYMDLVLMDRPDDYGNDGFVVQDPGKERRAKKEYGPIIGNWRTIGAAKPQAKQSQQTLADDEILY